MLEVAQLALLLALPKDLWATATPGAAGVLVLTLLLGGGLALTLLLLRADSDDEDDPAEEELERVAAARLRLDAELVRTGGAVRGALGSLIAAPLADVEERVARLAIAARACRSPGRRDELARLEFEEARLQRALALEHDERARALLEASLHDLALCRAVHADLARKERLALLELSRLRTLLDGLPARVRDLAGRRSLAGEADVEAIAHQLERAVQSTSDVLSEVEPTALPPDRARAA